MRLCYVESVAPEKPFIEPVSSCPRLTPLRVMDVICEHLSISRESIIGRDRSMTVAYGRHLCAYFMKRKLRLSYKAIGVYLGGKDHTTIISAERNIQNYIDTDYSTTRADIKAIEKILGV